MRSSELTRGFTLVEILAVLVLLGILVTIAWGKFHNTKEKALQATLITDMRNLATAQELYHRENGTYASAPAQIQPIIDPSPESTFHITTGNNLGWAGWNEINGTTMRCEFYVGSGVTPPLGYASASERVACAKS